MIFKARPFLILLLFIFPVCLYQFFNVIYIDKQIAKFFYFLILTFSIIFILPTFFKIKKQSRYELPVRIIFILIWMSMLSALFFWGQELVLSYRSTATYLGLVYFFLLMKIKPDIQQVEKIIWFFCGVFIILWFYGMLKAPQIIYAIDADTTMDDSRGIFRLALPGRGFLILAFFLAVSKFVQTKNNKWAIVFTFLFTMIVLQVTRQIIIFSFIVSLLYILRKSKIAWFVLIALGLFFIAGGSLINVSDNSVVGRMINISSQQASSQNTGEQNIRVLEYTYFLTNYSKNIITDIIGNGVPHFYSSYGLKEISIKEQFSYFMSDVGYAEIFVRFGILGVLSYLFIFWRAATQKVDSAYMYSKLFILYLAAANVTASWVFQDVIPLCISLYVLEQYNLFYRENKVEV